jgi:metal-sulfur cluster biosynthetic enzyme
MAGLESRVEEALNSVVDPCSEAVGVPAGLVDMGLVRRVAISPGEHSGQRVSVVLAVTHPSCLMAPVFVQRAEQRLAGLSGVESVDVALDHGFSWTEKEMAEEYRSRLLAHRAVRASGVR